MVKKIIANGNDVKTKMLSIIKNVIEENGWTQQEAADVLKLAQPKVSLIKNLKTEEFSLGRILTLLSRLGFEVEVTVKKAKLN